MCLLCSTIFHLYCDCNVKVNKVVSRLDQAVIAFLIAGSTYPPYYYGYYCETGYVILYLTITGSMSCMLFIISLCDFIHTEKWRGVKGILYGGVGIASSVGFV